MAIVRCPSCDRALRLPDGLRTTKVRCPVCDTTFTKPIAPLVPPRTKPSYTPSTSLSISPLGDQKHEDQDEDSPIADIRFRLNEAARWMRWMVASWTVAFFLYWPIACCCLGYIAYLTPRSEAEELRWAFLASPVMLLLLLLEYLGAYALETRRSYRAAVTGAVVALLLSMPPLLLVARTIHISIRNLGAGHPEPSAVAAVLVGIVAICWALTTSFKAFSVLFEPDAPSLFD